MRFTKTRMSEETAQDIAVIRRAIRAATDAEVMRYALRIAAQSKEVREAISSLASRPDRYTVEQPRQSND